MFRMCRKKKQLMMQFRWKAKIWLWISHLPSFRQTHLQLAQKRRKCTKTGVQSWTYNITKRCCELLASRYYIRNYLIPFYTRDIPEHDIDNSTASTDAAVGKEDPPRSSTRSQSAVVTSDTTSPNGKNEPLQLDRLCMPIISNRHFAHYL